MSKYDELKKIYDMYDNAFNALKPSDVYTHNFDFAERMLEIKKQIVNELEITLLEMKENINN